MMIKRDLCDLVELYWRDVSSFEPLSREREIELFVRAKQGDEEARQEIITANLRFVVSIAKEYMHYGLSLAELISEGNLGLLEASRRFDETRGFKFITYAVWWIRQAIFKALSEHGHAARAPMSRVSDLHRMEKEDAKLAQKLGRDPSIDELAKSAGLSLNRAKDAMELTEPDLCLDAPSFEERDGDTWINNFPDPEQEDIGEALEQEEKMLSLCQCMECLDERESRIIILYFGLDSEEPMTLEQIGTLFGVTRERVRQLRNSALEKLRARHGEILEELASA